MSKRIAKGLAMFMLVVGLAFAATVQSAKAQTPSDAVTADIPFDFIVGSKTLPSGRYTVSWVTSDGEGLRIMSQAGKAAAFRLTNRVSEKSDHPKPRMVFRRYGQQYFLTQVWTGDSSGRQLRPGKKERDLRNELASNSSKSPSASASYDTVEVLALAR